MGDRSILKMFMNVYKDNPAAIDAINETLSKKKKAKNDSNVGKGKIKKLQPNSTAKKTAIDDSEYQDVEDNMILLSKKIIKLDIDNLNDDEMRQWTHKFGVFFEWLSTKQKSGTSLSNILESISDTLKLEPQKIDISKIKNDVQKLKFILKEKR